MANKKATPVKEKKATAPKATKPAEAVASTGPFMVVKKVTDLSRGTTVVTRETVAKL